MLLAMAKKCTKVETFEIISVDIEMCQLLHNFVLSIYIKS